MQPVKIEVTDDDKLNIIWDDNSNSNISLLDLRKACPCAICSTENENFSHSYKVYRGDETEISHLSVVGNYALSIVWKDGHNTGIYEFEYLMNLADKEK
ncbi:MAG: DUF971 domain-containing protein [Bacteroidota bacterium]